MFQSFVSALLTPITTITASFNVFSTNEEEQSKMTTNSIQYSSSLSSTMKLETLEDIKSSRTSYSHLINGEGYRLPEQFEDDGEEDEEKTEDESDIVLDDSRNEEIIQLNISQNISDENIEIIDLNNTINQLRVSTPTSINHSSTISVSPPQLSSIIKSPVVISTCSTLTFVSPISSKLISPSLCVTGRTRRRRRRLGEQNSSEMVGSDQNLTTSATSSANWDLNDIPCNIKDEIENQDQSIMLEEVKHTNAQYSSQETTLIQDETQTQVDSEISNNSNSNSLLQINELGLSSPITNLPNLSFPSLPLSPLSNQLPTRLSIMWSEQEPGLLLNNHSTQHSESIDADPDGIPVTSSNCDNQPCRLEPNDIKAERRQKKDSICESLVISNRNSIEPGKPIEIEESVKLPDTRREDDEPIDQIEEVSFENSQEKQVTPYIQEDNVEKDEEEKEEESFSSNNIYNCEEFNDEETAVDSFQPRSRMRRHIICSDSEDERAEEDQHQVKENLSFSPKPENLIIVKPLYSTINYSSPRADLNPFLDITNSNTRNRAQCNSNDQLPILPVTTRKHENENFFVDKGDRKINAESQCDQSEVDLDMNFGIEEEEDDDIDLVAPTPAVCRHRPKLVEHQRNLSENDDNEEEYQPQSYQIRGRNQKLRERRLVTNSKPKYHHNQEEEKDQDEDEDENEEMSEEDRSSDEEWNGSDDEVSNVTDGDDTAYNEDEYEDSTNSEDRTDCSSSEEDNSKRSKRQKKKIVFNGKPHLSKTSKSLSISNRLTPYSKQQLTSPPTPKLTSKNRVTLTKQLFDTINSSVFANQLPLDFSIKWSHQLKTTAGRCHMSTSNLSLLFNGRVARIELASKVLDTYRKLESTLCHEMCHAASWLIDGVSRPPHGEIFKRWGEKVTNKFSHVQVKSCHNYTIYYKWRYQCQQCHSIVGRHTNSLNIDTWRCRCGGYFDSLGSFKQDNTPIKSSITKKVTGFALFVKEKYQILKFQLQKEQEKSNISHSEMMKYLSEKWKGGEKQKYQSNIQLLNPISDLPEEEREEDNIEDELIVRTLFLNLND